MDNAKRYPFLQFLIFFASLSLATAASYALVEKWSPTLAHENLVPDADFEFDTSISCSRAAIAFTDLSSGDSLTYEWNFGDPNAGELNTSFEQHPIHEFVGTPGTSTETFAVSLTVTEPDGTQSTVTKDITLNQAPSLEVGTEQDGVNFDDLQYVIICENDDSEFVFYNQSTTQETNVSYTLDWGDGSEKFTGTDWTELSHSYSMGVYRLIYSVTGPTGCTATEEYGIFVGSNPAVGLGNPGNTNVCGGQTLTFPITGTENNPTGTIYTVDYSDGSPPETYNHPPPASVTHTFDESSCGVNSGNFPNSYSVSITASNPCSASSAVVSPIYVSEIPDPEFDAPEEPVCVDTPIPIQNLTEFGGEVTTNGECEDLGIFVWQISPETGWELSSGTLGNQLNPSAPNSWSNGSEIIRPVFSEAGTYTVRLITGNRCGINEEVKTICVNETPEPAFELSTTSGCGPLAVSVTNTSFVDTSCGENAVYNWSIQYQSAFCGSGANWEFSEGTNQNSVSPAFNFLGSGRYTLNLSMETNCGTFYASEEVEVYAPPLVELSPISSICEPTTITPSATVEICDIGEATYQWTFVGGSPSSSTTLDPGEVLFDTPGEKTIILSVSSACGVSEDSVSFFYNVPPVAEAGDNSTICLGETVALAAAGPSEDNLSVQWSSPNNTSIADANSPLAIASPIETTVFSLRVTDTETGCFSTDEVTVTVEPAPVITFSQPDQVICSGETSTAVTLSSAPGTTLEWTADFGPVTGGLSNGTTEIPAQTLINLSSAPVDVTFTGIITDSDQGACAVQPATYTITVQPELNYPDAALEICNGETFNFLPENHISGAGYQWSVLDPGPLAGTNDQATASASISQTLINPGNSSAAATYEITPVLEGCQGDPFVLQVTVIPSSNLSISSVSQEICSGSASEEVTLSNNIPDADFSWTATANGAVGVITAGDTPTIPAMELTNPTDAPIQVIFTGTSSAMSQGDCAGNTVSHTVTVYPAITIQEDMTDYSGYAISCFGANDGRIAVVPTGGNGQYQYAWSGPDGFTATDAVIENLAVGTYELTVQDGAGCEATSSYTLTSPAPVQVNLVETTAVYCAGEATGAISMEATGGNPNIPFTYSWQKDGQAFGQTGAEINNLPAGEYTLTVFNGDNCATTSQSITITEPDSPLLIAYEKEDISCYGANDGTLALDIQGGVPPYTVSWDFGSSQLAFTDLGPDVYTVTVADQAGCIKTENITIEDAPLFQVTPSVSQITCTGANDGSKQLDLQQNNLDYTIRWDHGPELENIFNLSPGSYGVTIEQADGCSIRQEFNLLEPAPLVIESQVVDALDCDNPQSGSLSIGISGGTPPYAITWSNGATTPELSGLTAGQYQVSVTDNAGCNVVKQMEVKRPAPIEVISTRNTTVACEANQVTEEIALSISGGTPPYSINWSGGEITNNGLNMTTTASGLFTAEITDGSGCLVSESFSVENPPTVVNAAVSSEAFATHNAHLAHFEVAFQNLSTGSITHYFWDFGDGTTSTEEHPRHTYKSAGTYQATLVVTDAFGCTSETVLRVEVTDHAIMVPNVFSPNDDGLNDHFFPKFRLISTLEFWVFNKWGEVIYHTEDLNAAGWDGTVNGTPADAGNYVYKLNYTTMDGRSDTMTDVFMLLK
ncbi:PKD domain-containing protein [Echinicola vietnamensis]|uniref:PDK repeat-containing protein n=1 Tax=Echinicola vietnamensis (strain DSM 17526 / LMG 23754 / KMM 6221) TaxID=926556 RepID=L0FW95_ECHVK|nr:PKD domain-containing protein [Echinicola vietnamensis]AGA78174.1 PDK repeat-containing protein [Echinicola vietnamensis DSM 17526]